MCKDMTTLLKHKLIRPSQAAAMLGVSRSTMYRWLWEGKIHGVKLKNGPVRIFEDDVLNQIADGEYDISEKIITA